MKDGSEWTPKDGKTETEVERCYSKDGRKEHVYLTIRQCTILEIVAKAKQSR